MSETGQAQIADTSGIADGDGHFLHDHPDVMNDPAAKNALAKYKTPTDAMLGGVEAMKLIGKPHINIPGDDADDATKTAFKAKIAEHTGALLKAEDVKITRPDGSTAENYNEALEGVFKETVVATGMNQAQTDATYGLALKMIAAVQDKEAVADKTAETAFETKMTSELGGETNYKAFCELNTRCLETFFGAETAKMIDEKGMGNNIEFAKGIQKLAEMAVKQGTSMKPSRGTGQKAGGSLTYSKMEERAAEN